MWLSLSQNSGKWMKSHFPFSQTEDWLHPLRIQLPEYSQMPQRIYQTCKNKRNELNQKIYE